MEGSPTYNSQHDAEPEHHSVLGYHREHSHDLQDDSLQRSLHLDFEQEGLTLEMKKLLSTIYKLGRKRILVSSHIKFLEICKEKDLIAEGLKFKKDNVEEEVIQKLKEAEHLQLEIKLTKNRAELKQVSHRFDKVVRDINEVFDEENKNILMTKFNKSYKKWKK